MSEALSIVEPQSNLPAVSVHANFTANDLVTVAVSDFLKQARAHEHKLNREIAVAGEDIRQLRDRYESQLRILAEAVAPSMTRIEAAFLDLYPKCSVVTDYTIYNGDGDVAPDEIVNKKKMNINQRSVQFVAKLERPDAPSNVIYSDTLKITIDAELKRVVSEFRDARALQTRLQDELFKTKRAQERSELDRMKNEATASVVRQALDKTRDGQAALSALNINFDNYVRNM